MSAFRRLLSLGYGKAVEAKDFLYDSGLADQIILDKPVLSIGNLSMGGTGKTPVVDLVIGLCLERGLKPCLISRNYKATSVGAHRVNIEASEGAAYYGDEPFWLAQKYPQVPVWTGPVKSQTALVAQNHCEFDLLIVDDGFQHRGLHRDFDFVLLDATSNPAEDQLVPLGRLREDFSGLDRSSLVGITKVNWAEPSRIHELKEKVPPGLESIEIAFQQKLVKLLPPGSKVMSVSGIANPDNFEKGLKVLSFASGDGFNAGFEVLDHVRYSDHQEYHLTDVQKILRHKSLCGADFILTTDKDEVKLRAFPELREFLIPVSVQLEFVQEPRGLHAFLDKCVRR